VHADDELAKAEGPSGGCGSPYRVRARHGSVENDDESRDAKKKKRKRVNRRETECRDCAGKAAYAQSAPACNPSQPVAGPKQNRCHADFSDGRFW
jgi:hypothetical protein